MRVAIVGSRNLQVNISKHVPTGTTTIITGGAKGIDVMAEAYADTLNIPKLIFKPEYDKYGKGAPIKRNKLIADNADMIIAIWDGKSHGTKNTIRYARKIGKPVEIHIIA